MGILRWFRRSARGSGQQFGKPLADKNREKNSVNRFAKEAERMTFDKLIKTAKERGMRFVNSADLYKQLKFPYEKALEMETKKYVKQGFEKTKAREIAARKLWESAYPGCGR